MIALLWAGAWLTLVALGAFALICLENRWHEHRCGGQFVPEGFADWRCNRCGKWL